MTIWLVVYLSKRWHVRFAHSNIFGLFSFLTRTLRLIFGVSLSTSLSVPVIKGINIAFKVNYLNISPLILTLDTFTFLRIYVQGAFI